MIKKESKEVWDERIASYRKSHMALSKWCEKHDVSEYTMKYHMYQAPSNNRHKNQSNDDTVQFLPATIIDTQSNASVEVYINHVSIQVNQDTDLSLLKKIVEVLS